MEMSSKESGVKMGEIYLEEFKSFKSHQETGDEDRENQERLSREE